MALTSLLLLAALASSAIAQSATVTPQPSSTVMVMPSTQTPMETPAPAVGNVSAEEVRQDHFFCLGIGSTRRDFLNITGTMNRLEAGNNQWPYRWGLWIQYPVLSYLDTMRKRHLFYVISKMVESGATSRNIVLPGSVFDNICVAEVEQYGVSTYRESVFVKLYYRDSTTQQTIENIDDAFRTAFDQGTYTRQFLDRTAINITATIPSMGLTLNNKTVNDSVHPGCDIVNCPEGDPTLLPIVLGTYVGQAYYGTYQKDELPDEVTIETLERLERSPNATLGTFYRLNPFANNPRPINYGLEAGDIVFAVFGSVFLTILVGAIILGFVIHPFFLA